MLGWQQGWEFALSLKITYFKERIPNLGGSNQRSFRLLQDSHFSVLYNMLMLMLTLLHRDVLCTTGGVGMTIFHIVIISRILTYPTHRLLAKNLTDFLPININSCAITQYIIFFGTNSKQGYSVLPLRLYIIVSCELRLKFSNIGKIIFVGILAKLQKSDDIYSSFGLHWAVVPHSYTCYQRCCMFTFLLSEHEIFQCFFLGILKGVCHKNVRQRFKKMKMNF